MPAIQTSYTDLTAARAGARADMTPAAFISRTVETAAGIAFGVPVSQGSEDGGCVAYAGDFVGVTVRNRDMRPETPDKYAQYESANLMIKGTIWVAVAAAVSAGDPVYINASGGWEGAAGTGHTLMSSGRWDTTQATPGGFAKLRLA